jgi:VTC domain
MGFSACAQWIIVSQLDDIVGRFEPVSLQAMENVKLLERFDTKYTFRNDQLPGILDEMVSHYRVLEVEGTRFHRYETVYFDTDNLDLYSKHHSGKFIRQKVRYRKYLDSQLCFFEIKSKSNKGRTLKKRIRRTDFQEEISGESEVLLRAETLLSASDIRPMLRVNFTRLTFVGKPATERLTIDLNLSYQIDGKSLYLPKLVIAELKRDKSSSKSFFTQAMRRRRIWEGSMSKYCFGIVNLYPLAKRNRFNERIRQINDLIA